MITQKYMALLNKNWFNFVFTITIFFLFSILSISSYATANYSNNYIENLYDDQEQHINDPLEGINRKIFRFNTVFDELALKPVAGFYGFVMPTIAKKRMNCVLSNLQEPLYTVHGLLMLNPKQTFHSLFRFIINSTFGVLGLFDIASLNNLHRKQTTFGEVLAYYRIKPGPYLVLPILGPSTFRNGVGTGIDFFINPVDKIKDSKRFNSWRYGLMLVSKREALLVSSKMLRETSLDSYAMVRSIYLQKLKGNYE